MKYCLLSIGSFPERALPTISSAFTCGAVNAVPELDIFQIFNRNDVGSADTFIECLTRCHDVLSASEGMMPVFPTRYSFDSCKVELASPVDFAGDSDSSALLAALRGRNLPLSFQKDREVIEWSFACLLNDRPNDSCDPFFRFIASLRTELLSGGAVRLALLCDFADPFSTGIVFALLPWLRRELSGDFAVSLIALAETTVPMEDSFYPSLDQSMKELRDRCLIRTSEDSESSGADAMWFISMPSTILDTDHSHGIAFLAAARALSAFYTSDQPFSPGLHTCEAAGSVSMHALGNRAVCVAAFIEYVVWLISDILPALRDYLDHPSRFRTLPNSRNGLFRTLFPPSSVSRVSASVGLIEKTILLLLNECMAFLQSIPSALRYSDEAQLLWQKATDACGRYITIAAEIDVTRTEIRESGLEGIKPVHRESLADTDEEHLQRKLEQMDLQLENESGMRDEALSAVGPFRALQARRDCCLKCRSALESAKKKMASLPAETTDHLTFALQERRIRLLESAVRQSEADLLPAAAPVSDSGGFPSGLAIPVIMPSDALLAIRKLISAGNRESSVKNLRECLPSLLLDVSYPDAKELWKMLLSQPQSGLPLQPFAELLRRAWRVCVSCSASLRFVSHGDWPAVPLLPDLLPSEPLTDIQDLLRLIPRNESSPDQAVAEKRGLLAMLFLAHYKRRQNGDPKLESRLCRNDATLPRCWLPGQHDTGIHLLSLSAGDSSQPFAVIVPGKMFLPARRTPAHTDLVPSFVTWFRKETSSFDDPCASLSEGDRLLIAGRIDDIMKSLPDSGGTPLLSFLSSFRDELNRKMESAEPDPDLSVRITAVCGLQHLAAYQDILLRIPRFYEHFLGVDPVASSLTGIYNFQSSRCTDIPDEVLYTWHGQPFAREHSRLVFESTCTPGEHDALVEMENECRVLSGSSDDYRDALSREAGILLDRFPDAAEENADLIRRLIRKAEKPLSDQSPELVWPWNPDSPSIRTILTECLGESRGKAFARPFSDLMTVFPARGGDAIGDSYFGVMCSVLPYGSGKAPSENPPVISPDAVLPPLSPSIVSAVCTTSEGRVLLTPDFISMNHPDDHSFRVTLTLNGAFTLRLSRVYSENDLLFLYAQDLPTLALWPSVPFPEDQWHIYYVYAHLPELFSLSVLPAGSADPVLIDSVGSRCSASFSRFPAAFLFFRDGQSIGALPNLLPVPESKLSGEITACIDFGSAATSIVLSSGETRKPLQGSTMVRILLNNPASTPEYLSQEFLPAVPVSALLPSVTRVFRECSGTSPVPFVDGIVWMSRNLQDVSSVPADSILDCPKWQEDGQPSDMICLHQIMLMTALQARTDGASGLSWRFAVPDEMPHNRRDSLAALFRRLADQVSEESGFSRIVEGSPCISFASESSALGAYFRLCAWEDTRGGFMVLDLGACSADISLFLRGKQQSVRTCQIPLGVHYMLLPSLLRDPLMLNREFGTYPNPSFQTDLNSLTRILDAVRLEPDTVQKARIALDHFLEDHYLTLISAMGQLGSAGIVSRFGAVLLLHLSYITMLSGLVLLQIAADPNKNDFLPEQMSLCLSGRGSLLIESLPDSLKSDLWRFLTMFRNKRVASLSLLFSAEKKMEIPVGLSVLQDVSDQLPPSSAVPASISVRPEELLPEFLLRFCRVFPREAGLLFPGFFTADYYHPFSPSGEAAVTAAIDRSFTAQDTPRPYDSLARWIAVLLDILPGMNPDTLL